jgi:hypothetical protein
MEIRFARSATKHRISRERSLYVIEHSGKAVDVPMPVGPLGGDNRIMFLGDDSEGVALEVIAAESSTDVLVVIHAMRLRKRYHSLYEEAKRWRI